MKKVVLLNGSPRLEEKTASAGFLARVDGVLEDGEFEKHFVNIRKSLKNGPGADYTKLLEADAIVNCGFPEPEINAEAVRVIGCFSRHVSAQLRFGVLIGGGPMISSAEGAGPKKRVQEGGPFSQAVSEYGVKSYQRSAAASCPDKTVGTKKVSAALACCSLFS